MSYRSSASVFNMSICFSYCCRIGQHSYTGISPNEMATCDIPIRLSLIEWRGLGFCRFKLHMLICRWIKHVCTFQYREHPCYTRDLANHSLLSKRLHRIASVSTARPLPCMKNILLDVTSWFIFVYVYNLEAVTLYCLFNSHYNHGNQTAMI